MDDLEEILRASAPLVDVEGSRGAARDVASAVSQRFSRRQARRLKRRAMVIAAAGLVLAPAVAAAAVHFQAETGRFGLPGFTENDTSQYIDMCAPDILRYVETLEPRNQPLPPGTTWSWGQLAAQIVQSVDSNCPPQGPGQTEQVTGIKGELLGGAECPWEQYALAAAGQDAAAERHRAGASIAGDEDQIHAIGDDGDSGWTQRRNDALKASPAWFAYDYQVNCLGRNTAANPPTVPDPN